MAGLWQRTGTATVTNGSKTVTGSGTKWKTGTLPIQKGHTFYGPDNWAYEVDTVVSDTEILLVENYRGGTLANQAYRIDITRTSTISQFAADLASLVGKYRAWFDGMMTWLTGSGDVSILNPDTGANTTIPSWTKVASEGEGQAARAKTEADKAAASAALAGDIVVASALPMPDVWAPLSDSLRLITGYGRDVLVGSDVVARMVNFSRNSTATYIGKDGQLKTAAANEPRFEKEGLLIEGQSTNLFLNSENVAVWANPSSASASTRELQAVQGGLVTCKVSAPSANGGVRQPYNSPAGGVHTVSFYLSKNSQSLKFLLENGGAAWGMGAQAAIAPATGTITVLAGITAAKSIPFLDGYIYQLTLPAGKAGGVLNAEWKLDAAGDFYIGMPQLEALPFASSYIPTAGAAVTRAADVVNIPRLQNMGGALPTGLTVAITFNKIGFDLPFSNYVLSLIDITNADRYGISTANSMAESYNFDGYGNGFSVNVTKVRSAPLVLCLGIEGTRGFGINGTYTKIASGDPTPRSVTAGNIQLCLRVAGTQAWGHVRNFRMWRKELTAEQIRAIA